MAYTNSSMVVYKKLSPNHSGQRTHSIDRITPHCVVGQCTAEGLGEWFEKQSTQASSNYGIDKDGRVGMYVEEKNRSWCSSSNANDQRAITIECASETTEPYAFRDVVYQTLIKLCIDICKRNGKSKLIWFGDKDKTLNYSPKSGEMILTVHRWFANKSCPGNWMYARMGDLANKVTAQLGGGSGDNSGGNGSGTNNSFPAVPFMVKVIIDDLNIRTSGSMSGKVVGQTGKGTFTIIQVKNGWGKLKSGAGWIYLENASYCTIGKTVSPQQTEENKKEEKGSKEKVTGLQATVLKELSESDVIKKVGALFTADQKKSGILASVSLAQFILESGYGKSELAQNANNIFGMKCNLSGNTWSGSSWDGKNKYTKKTQEQNPDGSMVTITADFRKYPCIEGSIADHSAYLLGAKNGRKLRYKGLKDCKDYKKAVQIIKDGGYATSLTYVEKLCSIIERWNLTQYDLKDESVKAGEKQASSDRPTSSSSEAVKVPFLVKVSITDLNIRTGAGTEYARTQFIPAGIYTIVEVKSGRGSSSGWGRLKSGAGWIALDHVTRL
ncbi:MAG: glucosaminidase domain-containing protein [Oribacterium sp.]|nr:glucosaminidase domain-containing protein [Oribacterium sp.]